MSQQSKIDCFFPTIKRKANTKLLKTAVDARKRNTTTLINDPKRPKNMIGSPRKRASDPVEPITNKIPKVSSPSGKIVKIYPSQEQIYLSNENSPQKSSYKIFNTESLSRSQSDSVLNISQTMERSSSFTPKKSPRCSSANFTRSLSPRKLFDEPVSSEIIQLAIENLNLVKQGVIGSNDFDLEKIYACGKWDINYRPLRTDVVEKYETKDVIFPGEKHADHLFTMIVDVFSNALNCGYFDEQELDFLFSTLTLSAKSQMLLARLLKRKRSWHRISSIQYPEIAANLKMYFDELVEKCFCVSDIATEEVLSLLKLLQIDEIRKLCQKLKVDHRGSKDIMMQRLLQLNAKQKTWFVGAKSPSSVLKSSMADALGSCIRLSDEAIFVLERVFVLLVPCQDPAENTSDLFLMLSKVKSGEILFPIAPKERFPIFRNREHLVRYVEARNVYKDLEEATAKKCWETVRKNGHLAYERLASFDKEEESSLPHHIQKFIPRSVYTKILSKTIDAFKKSPDTVKDAVKYLRALIYKNSYGKSYLGRWYRELSLIEMHHRKDLRESANLTLEALNEKTLTQVDVMDLLERAKKLERRKNGIPSEMKSLIRDVLQGLERDLPAEFDVYVEIEANMVEGNVTGSKSTWSVDIGAEDKAYARVELIALRHYYKSGYPRGFHCEGSLPVTLFTVLFWSELYDILVPGAFVSLYQESPLDLYTSHFFENRKEKLTSKISFIRSLDTESFGELMKDEFIKYKKFKSTISSHLFESEQHFKEVAMSLGTTGVTGICERLANNFNVWKAGFPDLFVWNPLSNECKIVEVKGPRDSLSTKQKLWLQYLQQLGIRAEVCIVKAKGKNGKKY